MPPTTAGPQQPPPPGGSEQPLPSTASEQAIPIGLVAGVLVIGGAGLLAMGRAQRRRSSRS